MNRAVPMAIVVLMFSCDLSAKPKETPMSPDSIISTIDAVVRRKLAEGKRPNRLIKEKSPYLLQHAFNPVDWYPWGDESFEKARRENKPIFLSIGYSTCYWCHVMEREIFENDSIAAMMNKYVISIKVDREERPDIDHVYMTALQAMTGSGGWPMSIFMTPDRKPFFATTYIPPMSKYGTAGFPEVLERIHELWQNNRSKILESGEKINRFLVESAASRNESMQVDRDELEEGFNSFSKSYDGAHGGFGTAPKFPRPVTMNFLFRYFSRTGEPKASDMALETLRKMAEGGMYDQIGGGFHRYSTDEQWRVPHFEKMLYDQAQLVVSYLEAYQITHDEFFKTVAEEVLRYVQWIMAHPDGGFYSAEDAESDVSTNLDKQKEGAFYVWTKKELEEILDKDESALFEYRYGVEAGGNVNSDARGEFVGENILYVAHSVTDVAKHFGRTPEEVRDVLDKSRSKVFLHRRKRPRPHFDDKILVSWNGMMISAFARAYQVLGNKEFLTSANRAGQFLLKKMYDEKTGILLRRYRAGEARYEANLSDYAFFTQGLLDLYEASFDVGWLRIAIRLTENQIKLFYDSTDGGFYDNSGNDRTILIRSKESYDGAEPSGNSITILNLLRLSQMIGEEKFHDIAMKSLAHFGEDIRKNPQALTQFLVAVEFSLSKPKQIIIAGQAADPAVRSMIKEIQSRFIPNKILLLADGGDGQRFLASHVSFLAGLSKIGGEATSYVCENYTCNLPTTQLKTLIHILDQQKIDNKWKK